MRKPFKGKGRLTQSWGNKLYINGKDHYAQWGLKGHNGTDWGMPNGTEILAPHDGKIIEAYYDANGYGKYIKVENDKEGSILAHLQKYVVKIGDIVKEGQLIAYSNNTGASTGPHLHWGYYPIPRNRKNGYSGTVDPFPYLQQGGSMGDCLLPNNTEGQKTFEELVRKSSLYDGFYKGGYETVADVQEILQGLRQSLDDKENEKKLAEAKAEEYRKENNVFIAALADDNHLHCRQDKTEILNQAEKAGDVRKELEDLRTSFAALQANSGKTENELRAEIARLEALLKHQDVLRNAASRDLIKELIRRLVGVLDLMKR